MNITHFGSVRLRVQGSGNLLQRLISLDAIYQNVLTPVVMTPTTNRFSSTLANMSEQKAQLELKIEEIDEWFEIHSVIIYIKPIYTGFPQ